MLQACISFLGHGAVFSDDWGGDSEVGPLPLLVVVFMTSALPLSSNWPNKHPEAFEQCCYLRSRKAQAR